MTIFYNNIKAPTLIINVDNIDKPNKIQEFDTYTLLFKDDKLLGMNIFKIPSNLSLKQGLIYPSLEILEFIKKLTNIEIIHIPNFVVSYVDECEDIPNTHLHKCVIFDGVKKHNVVCGAKNIKKGLKIVLAKTYTIMPNGLFIVPNTLMGYESNGMVCSAKELNLAQDSNGILELDDSYNVGDEFLDVYQ